jgi:glycosyltransferase involved in cell wall biosynthesis
MRILLVSYYFPPYNTIGAVRTGKTARYLRQLGHDVRVLTAAKQPLQPTLPREIPDRDVIATSWIDVNRPVEWLLGGRGRVADRGYEPPGRLRGVMSRIGKLYRTLFHLPDAQIGWLPFAMSAGSQLLQRWKADVILASGLPVTALLVAARLSAKFNVPWVAELRDLWVDNPGYCQPFWRRRLDRWLERRLLSTASGLVTVSQPLADQLQRRYARPTAVVTNGFDPHDLAAAGGTPARGGPLQIVYTGMIYPGRQDPEPLMAALACLGPHAQHVRVTFYGRYLQSVAAAAARHGVEHLVETHDQVGYYESLRQQQQADVLLLLSECNPEHRGVYTGKLFEYLGARRPVLAIGTTDNVAAELLLERKAGVVLSNPAQIARQLQAWSDQKQSQGVVPAIPAAASAGLTRRAQVECLEQFMQKCLGESSVPKVDVPLELAA